MMIETTQSTGSASPTGLALTNHSGEETIMKSFDYAELFLNTNGRRGETELRAHLANGGDIQERDRDGCSALDIAQDSDRQDKSMKLVAPKLVELLKSLGA